MGQAKLRGTFEQRLAAARDRDRAAAEQRHIDGIELRMHPDSDRVHVHRRRNMGGSILVADTSFKTVPYFSV